ncbi:MAG: hypothetical protein WCA46_26595 [Actinocatenispora sp.]
MSIPPAPALPESVEPDWLTRYRAGQHVLVWREMRRLGAAIRTGALADEARAVVAETMSRVRENVELVRKRLLAVGYDFMVPYHEVHAPPADDTTTALDEFEAAHDVMPLSLRAFYEIVGTVDFRQAPDQLVRWYAAEQGRDVDELGMLGEYDPLVVMGLPLEPDDWDRRPDGGWFLAPDEFHKADYSGGENYHVLLPDAAADFRIDGMYGIDEWFVDYLRATFTGGGFRGRCESDGPDSRKLLPDLRICRELARDLVRF